MAGLRELGRVLVVVAHPDDETWAFGALLATLAATGAQPSVYCLTRGEAGLPPGGDPAMRVGEMHRACEVLGANLVAIDELADGNLLAARPAAQHGILRVLQLMRPDTVCTFDLDGGYGHSDHIATTWAVLDAVSTLPGASRPAVLLRMFPRGALEPVRSRLGSLPDPPPLDRGVALGRSPRDARLRVAVGPHATQITDALRCHATQCPKGDPALFLGAGRLDRLRRAEGGCEQYAATSRRSGPAQ